MSSPPQGPWQPPPPPPGQPYGPPPGGPVQGQPYGPPPGTPPPGPYPGWPPPQPPKKSNGLKWALGAVALVAVIAVAVAVTLAVSHSGSGGGPTNGDGSRSASGIASANDTGPVAVITDEPSCDQFVTIANAVAAQEQNGWDKRDPSIPAADWTPDQRNQYESVGTALRNSADQMVSLAKRTPHRVVRELYEQSIAYRRAYADSVPTYTVSDDQLVRTSIGADAALVGMCEAIRYGSAPTRALLVAKSAAPSRTASVGDPATPARFLATTDPICSDWEQVSSQFNADTADWRAIDSSIPALQWTPEQKDINDTAARMMLTFADKAEGLSQRTTNPILEDFLTLTAQYQRAYAKALPTYTPADGYLSNAGMNAGGTVKAACQAVGG